MNNPFESVFLDLQSLGKIQAFRYFVEIDSTNSAARRLAAENQLEWPALLVANRQTQGRGRGGHGWWSPDGCLMFTLLLPSSCLPQDRNQWGQLALVVGVSAAEAIESVCSGLDVLLKWPNDLMIRGKKTGGVLIESFNVLSHPAKDSMLFAIGCGININMNWHNAPKEILDRATCVSSNCGSPVQPQVILHELIQTLFRHLERWKTQSAEWYQAWNHRCFLSGKVVSINTSHSSTPQLIMGRCEGVANDGQLLVRSESGSIQPINVGTVVSWW